MELTKIIAIVIVVIILVIIAIWFFRPSTPSPTQEPAHAPTPATPTVDTSLVVYYPFDDSATDNSSNKYDATVVGNPTYITGKTGKAINLNGNKQYIQLPSGVLSSIKDTFTISFWVYPNVLSQWARLFDFGYGNTDKYMYMAINGQTTQFGRATKGNSDTVRLDPNPPASFKLTTGAWHHIVVVFNNGTVTQYMDGIQVGQIPFPSPFIYADSTANYIGKSQYATDPYFNGYIDEFKIYNVVKDPATV